MGLPPIFYHIFRRPLRYAPTLALQEQLHAIQLLQRNASRGHKDILLLLEHRPVYTCGRRQLADSPEVVAEQTRLEHSGADFEVTKRGGETTFHGPGQIVGYPLLDLGRTSPPISIRDYICKLQKVLESQLAVHGLKNVPSEHTGVFLDHSTKVASIGVQIRHRLTTHGFALNVTSEPLAWFDQVVACGLADVRAGCIANATGERGISVAGELPSLVENFGRVFGREMVRLDVDADGETEAAIRQLNDEVAQEGPWPTAPSVI